MTEVRQMHRRWVGSLSSLLLPGAGIFLAGNKKAGLQWFFGMMALWLIKAFLIPLPTIPNLVAGGIFLAVTLVLYCYLVARSYRPIPKIGFRGWLLFLALVLALGLSKRVTGRLFTHPFSVPVSSMEPTVQRGDQLFVQKYAYWFTEPKRGDVIVFKTDDIDHPQLPKGQFYIKRIAALPGEELQIVNGKLLVDGKPIESPAVLAGDNFTPHAMGSPDSKTHRFSVPTECYFVVGDNGTTSFDSRYYGPVPRSSILGKATKIYWPLQRQGDIR